MDFFRSDSFSAQVRHLMGQHHVPGLAIAITQDDEVASAAYGYASLEPEKPCTADTLFDIASCSKSMTAASVGLLVDDNKRYPEVQYDATMSSLLPEDFVMPNPEDTKRVTVDDVLGHMTGMADNEAALMGYRSAQPDTPRSVTRNLRHLPMAHAHRAKHEYCNIMYVAAAHLVAEKSGQRFGDFLEERIFRPLDMASTSLQPTSAEAKGFGGRLARGHDWRKGEERYVDFPQLYSPEGEGAGCVVTSANDLIKWVRAFLHRDGPISERVYKGLMYAAGLEVYWYRGYTIVSHYGGVPGFESRFFFLPEMDFGAVFMGNSRHASSVATALSRQLINALLKLPPVPRSVTSRDKNKATKTPKPAKTTLAVRPKTQSTEQTISTPKSEAKGENQSDESLKNEELNDQTTPKDTNQPKAKKPQKKEKKPRPQTKPLSAYVGRYWHPGYRAMTVEIKDDKLFIDGMDRSYYGCTLMFEHVAKQTKYTAHINYINETYDDDIRAEFVFGESGRAVKMGLHLEQTLKHLIWFELEKDT
ncbi:beta-lactamase family protein [Annulohypoxylon bovei var. microspora]|nr:beta-lactamase family protein [Annulohypoxylon bovei var. microspora]